MHILMVFFIEVIPEHIFCKCCKIRDFFFHCAIEHSKNFSRCSVAYRSTILFRNFINNMVNVVNSEPVKVKFFLKIFHIINKEFNNIIIILAIFKAYKIIWCLTVKVCKFSNIIAVKFIMFESRV